MGHVSDTFSHAHTNTTNTAPRYLNVEAAITYGMGFATNSSTIPALVGGACGGGGVLGATWERGSGVLGPSGCSWVQLGAGRAGGWVDGHRLAATCCNTHAHAVCLRFQHATHHHNTASHGTGGQGLPHPVRLAEPLVHCGGRAAERRQDQGEPRPCGVAGVLVGLAVHGYARRKRLKVL